MLADSLVTNTNLQCRFLSMSAATQTLVNVTRIEELLLNPSSMEHLVYYLKVKYLEEVSSSM